MKNLFAVSLLIISATSFAEMPIVFVAPASMAVAPSVVTLVNVVDAFKAVGTAFDLNDLAATGLLDQAALDLTLSINVQNIDTSLINHPVYDSATGLIGWENNFGDTVSIANNWTQTDTSGYDTKAIAFRDAGGAYAVTAIMTGGSGVNNLLSAIDGTSRIVNGVAYEPEGSFNSFIESFNTATTAVDKTTSMTSALAALTAIQAQATAMDIAGSIAVTTLNTYALIAAGNNAAFYTDLNGLLTYHSLQ